MDPKQVALFILIAVGAIATLVGVWVTARRPTPGAPDPKWKPVFLCLLGFGMIGVGGFQLKFLDSYAEFLTTIAALAPEAQAEQYAELIEDIASGKMPEKYEATARAIMLQHPTRDLEAMLEAGATNATPDRKEFLDETRVDLTRKFDVSALAARAIVEASPDANRHALRGLDSSSLQTLATAREGQLADIPIDRRAFERAYRDRFEDFSRRREP